MKVNLQKIISSIFVLCICFSLLGISASSYTGDVDYIYTTEKEAYLDIVNTINAYSNGEISYNDFASDLVYYQGKAVTSGFDVAAVKIKQFVDVCNLKFGPDTDLGGSEHGGGGVGGSRTPITDIWNDICNKNNVPTETTQTSTTDTQGYGALAVRQDSATGQFYYYYCDYIILGDTNKFNVYGFAKYCNSASGTIAEYNPPRDNTYSYNDVAWKFYGDVRYPDNTPAPSDDDFVYGTINNFDEMDDKELVKLINELSEELQLQYPDLSSLEGLLNAIYARMSKLDSDDDNELLSQVLTAINSLKTSSNKNASDIISILEDIKKSLVFEDGENLKALTEQLKAFIDNQITADDFVVDEDMYNNNLEILKLRLLGKFSLIEDLKTFVSHIFDSYKNTSDNPKISIRYSGGSFLGNDYDIDFSVFYEFLPLIRCIIAAFIYISYALHTYKKIPSYINGGDNL